MMMNEQFGVAICDVVSRVIPPTIQETKIFEEYLLIKNTIEHQCTHEIKEVLLQKLTQLYVSGGKEVELMGVLRWIRK